PHVVPHIAQIPSKLFKTEGWPTQGAQVPLPDGTRCVFLHTYHGIDDGKAIRWSDDATDAPITRVGYTDDGFSPFALDHTLTRLSGCDAKPVVEVQSNAVQAFAPRDTTHLATVHGRLFGDEIVLTGQHLFTFDAGHGLQDVTPTSGPGLVYVTHDRHDRLLAL